MENYDLPKWKVAYSFPSWKVEASVSDLDPEAALGLVDNARNSVAERIGRGGWRYDLAYSALAGMMVAGQALSAPYNTISVAVGIMGLGLLVHFWTAKTGVWVSGISPKRARWVSIALGLVVAAIMIGVAWANRLGMSGLAIPAGVVSAVAALIFSRAWRRVWLKEIGGAQ